MSDPLVSIVIPAYNASETVRECLESVLNQCYRNLEIVVVDDGSSDGTASELARYADRIKLHRQSNGGLAAARNAGMRLASGQFIAWLDADDICAPNRIAAQVAYFQQLPELVLCSTNFIAFGQGRTIPSAPYLADYYSSVGQAGGGLETFYLVSDKLSLETPSGGSDTFEVRSGRVFENLVWGNFVHPPTVMFRRELLDAAGMLLEDMRNLCDYEWFLRAALHGPFGFIDAPLIRYRLSPGQMSGDANTLVVKSDLIRVLEIVRRLAPEFAANNATRLRSRKAQALLGVSNALCDAGRGGAWRFLFASIRSGGSLRRAARVALKLVLPRRIVAWRRSALLNQAAKT